MSGVRIEILARAEAGRFAAERIVERARSGRLRTLGVATGSSAEPVYEALVRLPGARAALAGVTAYALDEYVGLADTDANSYRTTLERQFTQPLGLTSAALRVPDGTALDPRAEAGRYERELAERGGADLQLLGIGSNGHIAFNEPGADLDGRTHVVELTAQTRADNARFFTEPGAVPTLAITQGVGTIMSADELLLLAFGPEKADALHAALTGPVTSAVPASAVQAHRRVTVLADEAAAGQLLAGGALGERDVLVQGMTSVGA
ncbi:glucosamine-6-phosphate deaminase [Agromyces silvae]|uniref:glucosamine-6-phosphate deaminase n=1 Tax=Agromyces silvae TaxID=3388266 RepID=UPI00280A852E|nr:glucosamine-6-phosphate deaminase [Agromyces protaetiae]